MATPFFGQRVEDALGPGLGGQDAFDGVERMGAESHGSFQGGEQILAGVGAQKRQHLGGLMLALPLLAEQTVEKTLCASAEFGEAFAKLGLVLTRIGVRTVGLVFGASARDVARPETVAGDFLDVRTVDDQFGLGDAHGQRLPEMPPGD